jgi:MFS family permease
VNVWTWVRSLVSAPGVPAAPLKRWRPIRGPMVTAWTHRGRLFVYFIANIVVGLIGALVPVLVPIFNEQYTYTAAMVTALRSGSLYTFGIALLASSVILVLQSDHRRQTSREIEDTRRSSVIATFAFVSLLGILTGMLSYSESINAPALQQMHWALRDTIQFTLVGIGILIAMYLFLLASYEEAYESFAEEEDAHVDVLVERSRDAAIDSRGINLAGEAHE